MRKRGLGRGLDALFDTTSKETMKHKTIPELAKLLPRLADVPIFQKLVHENAVAHGWWDKSKTCEKKAEPGVEPVLTYIQTEVVSSKLALIHSEVSEALEAVRLGNFISFVDPDTGKPEGMAIELADVIIRIFDLAESLGLDIEEALRAKHSFNVSRSHRHGGKTI
jgi:NTP pyrophosphatase (non-canonical NTP hydrolase)